MRGEGQRRRMARVEKRRPAKVNEGQRRSGARSEGPLQKAGALGTATTAAIAALAAASCRTSRLSLSEGGRLWKANKAYGRLWTITCSSELLSLSVTIRRCSR